LKYLGPVDGLNLYVYVGNNPLKYKDPTGHVKTKIEQENAEEGAGWTWVLSLPAMMAVLP
jgi:hypothetical protein